MNTIHTWVLLGLAEVLLSLVLLAIAPQFLNSETPIVGFLIWGFVPILIGSSGAYVASRLTDAHKSRQLFIHHFPEYAHLGVNQFLDIPTDRVARNLDLLAATREDPDFQSLHISLLDLLRRSKKQ